MARVVSVFLPSWSTDRMRRVLRSRGRAHLPEEKAAPRADLNDAARAGLVVREGEPEADRAGLERLALWAQRRYAPIVAADPPDGIVLDTTGADHLHGGEAALLRDLVGRLGACGICARAAVAGSWGAAHGVARTRAAPVFVVAPGRDAAVVRDLPVAALRLPGETAMGLRVLGIARVGQLEAMPRGPLALRFGPWVGRRLDQAFGRAAEPIVPVRDKPVVRARENFAEPIVSAEAIGAAVQRLVEGVCAGLAERGLGARSVELRLHRTDRRVPAVRVGLARAVRDARRIAPLIGMRISQIDPGLGIETMVLAVTRAETLAAVQAVSTLGAAEEADISELIERLMGRVGAEQVYRFAPVESFVPERSVRRVAPLAAGGGDFGFAGARPVRLLAQPEAIETIAMLPDHPPVMFVWRGRRHKVRCADGPERIFGEWWKRDAEMNAARDYFQAEDETGGRFWIYRAGDGKDAQTGSQKWFLHGVFG